MYKVGTRIKKVRGCAPGTTAIIVNEEVSALNAVEGYDQAAKLDKGAVNDRGKYIAAGAICSIMSHQWEPIIPEGSAVPAKYTIQQLLSGKVFDKDVVNVD